MLFYYHCSLRSFRMMPGLSYSLFFVTFRSHGNGVTCSKIFLCAFNSQTQQNPMLGARILVIFRIGYEPVGVFLPRGNFLHYFFWNPNVSWAFFTCSAIWRLGRLWVIEVKGHQVHFWMWSISWSLGLFNDYLVCLSVCTQRPVNQIFGH